MLGCGRHSARIKWTALTQAWQRRVEEPLFAHLEDSYWLITEGAEALVAPLLGRGRAGGASRYPLLSSPPRVWPAYHWVLWEE